MDSGINCHVNFHVLTLFPDMVRQGLSVSVTGRAFEKGVISLNTVNIRDYTLSRHRKVDDYPYGGGAGMLMQAQPVYDAFRAVADDINAMGRDGEKARVIFVTPQGQSFHQAMAKELAKEKDLIFLCGHYEGIDERVLEEIVTDYVSIGDYVLTGGELPAMVMIDAISRMVPDVLNNGESAEIESFGNYLLEYPQYSRPEVWRDKRVPEILLSGNHEKVEEWRLNQSLERTRRLRPELYEKWAAENQAYFIKKAKREERARKKALKNQRKNAVENG